MATTINPSNQTITQYNIQTGGANNLLNNVAPSGTSGVPVISQGASSQPVFGTVVVAGGGTGQVTLTNHGVLVGAATAAITQLAAGSAGQVLQSGGASADPAYSTSTYPATATGTGTILRADGTNWVASTPTYPNAASTALKHIKSDGTNFVTTTVTYPDASVTAGKVMVSDGTNYIASTPTFPNASAASRKIIVSDGTNWVASTETYAVPGASGNVLTSDGTNWTSAAASSGVSFTQVTISSANFKTSNTTPIQIVAAPGAGKVIFVLGCIFKLNYGGTNAFTGTGAVSIIYTTNAGTIYNGPSASSYTGTTNNAYSYMTLQFNGVPGAVIENNSVSYKTQSSNPAGNAAGDNTVTVGVFYQIVTVT